MKCAPPLNAVIGFCRSSSRACSARSRRAYREYAGLIGAAAEHLLSIIKRHPRHRQVAIGQDRAASRDAALAPVVEETVR